MPSSSSFLRRELVLWPAVLGLLCAGLLCAGLTVWHTRLTTGIQGICAPWVSAKGTGVSDTHSAEVLLMQYDNREVALQLFCKIKLDSAVYN